MLHGHGDDIASVSINFSSNVWYGGVNQRLIEHLSCNLSKLDRYPQPLAEDLRSIIGDYHNLTADQLLITNGATEAIYLIAQAWNGSQTSIVRPTFSEYADACILNNHSICYIDENVITDDLKLDCHLAFICNPNNPTGKQWSAETLQTLISLNPQTIFVIDEAYADFVGEPKSLVSLLDKVGNLLIIKSLTKTFAIPGLRLGYVLASAPLISLLERYKMPWSVNSVAIEAGKFIFSHLADFRIDMDALLSETQRLRAEINDIQGFKAHTSDTSFFLCQTEYASAADLKTYLLDNYKILIRDASNFNGLSAEWFRLSTQSRENNNLLISALQKWKLSF